ncbi:hypothetical protein O1M63_15870 [Streptomyces mirabilis]|nr:hypothetical protein [Streptomyces mirabilis]
MDARTGRTRSSPRSYSLVRYRGRSTGSSPSKGIGSVRAGFSGRTRVKWPSTVRSSSPAAVQRGGTGARSPASATGVPSTTRAQDARGSGDAQVREAAAVGGEGGVMTCAAVVSVCSTTTGPAAPAGTAAMVRASRPGPVGRVTAFARTKRTRLPSGDQVGSKSSQGPSCSGPS